MSDQNTEQNQGSTPEHDVDHVIMMPNIEEGVPIPKNSKEAMPEMSMEQEINIRAETVKTMADLKGEPIEPTEKDQKEATTLAKEIMTNPMFKPEYGNYTNETMAFLAGLVGQTQCMLVKDLADYKLYVINNLVKVIESTENPKEKTTALRALGEVDGVDVFKKKTEVTHKVESMEEVEKELLSMLAELKQKGLVKEKEVIDAEVVKEDGNH
jgi:hypothetical protein